ncbi:Lrp/AsnC family transcriptional regulator [Vibrio sagamiensis]|uniref:ArsR family transcriptional regulator n=1 Tax=Vibrio sagamiensis NBRC 104589 TaxID=1219064 RepID=A0A511QF64_9VIBR|nr:Lrp/AsnC family transcriptional regulator [Vibrio sagamiensis]PNQ54502.1 Lrp/AsnC family transcriptional regulator [Vibrio agarivorans]GEM75837.1 ArsR family transcriptional regulator [Vibrio sagamiensis NBRC 104589]
MIELDKNDLAILSILQENCRSSLDLIADEVGLSIVTVQRRIKRLRDSGVILRDVSVLDPDKLGWKMTFLVLVEMNRERSDMLDKFRKRMINEPQVQQCYYITGEADFALICLAKDMEDFELLTHKLFFDDPNIRRFKTNVVMRRNKVGLDVMIEPRAL